MKGLQIATKGDKEMKLEESFKKLEEILIKLEEPSVTLEDSFTLYQEGVKLLKLCNDSIDKVEKELIILDEDGGSDEL
ncbi:MAG TPA: exodeoxyribonuclease VII small subunit [Clostridiales bacterium]|nr:exodeoxyribonuclease VII small subunit [Clostridiales bacterium]